MYRRIRAALLAVFVLLSSLGIVAASEPIAGCPPGFVLHAVMHDGEHGHPHVGTAVDQTADGWICVKHLPTGIHVHIDNNVRQP
jgi:hypothetical protein